MKSRTFRATLVFSFSLLILGANSQLPKLPGVGGIPGLDSLFKEDPPITTSLKDAVTELPFLDDFNPHYSVDLTMMPRTDEGNFTVFPGEYSFQTQSYCLHAGTHGPGKGEGYLYAPLKGPKSKIVRSILQRSFLHAEIPQGSVQRLIWSVLARTKPSKLDSETRVAAESLLKPEELKSLEGSAWDVLKETSTSNPFISLPGPLRQVMEAENRMRSMFYSPNISYGELERVAVLSGEYVPQKGDRQVPRGRWSFVSEGHFIRFFPNGYHRTSQDVYFPEKFILERDSQKNVVRISDVAGRKISRSGNDVTYSENGKEMAKATISSTKQESDKRKSEFEATLKKLKLDKAILNDLVSIADIAVSFGSDGQVSELDARDLAFHAWMSVFAGKTNDKQDLFAMVDELMDAQGGYDASGGVATPADTGRQRLAQSPRCQNTAGGGNINTDDPRASDFQKAVVNAMRKKGYQIGPENVTMYRRGESDFLRFVVRMSRDGKPLPSVECVEEMGNNGQIPPHSQEGAKELFFGSVQEAGSTDRVAVRTVDVETGVITGAGKGDGGDFQSATDAAFSDYERWPGQTVVTVLRCYKSVLNWMR